VSDYDESEKRLTLKLVFYGPAQSGKTTNLAYLHDHSKPELKGEMMVLETKGDRTLFFDLLPMGMKCPSGLKIKLKVFTVPGQAAHDSTRKAVLSRADGVIFVADSQENQGVNNLTSFENLIANVARVGLNIEELPVVVQFNKRDLEQILSEENILKRWQQTQWQIVFSSALKGQGVTETFAALLGEVYDKVNEEHRLQKEHEVTKAMFIKGLQTADQF
jgi:signal recognition particle receptor subunit beta